MRRLVVIHARPAGRGLTVWIVRVGTRLVTSADRRGLRVFSGIAFVFRLAFRLTRWGCVPAVRYSCSARECDGGDPAERVLGGSASRWRADSWPVIGLRWPHGDCEPSQRKSPRGVNLRAVFAWSQNPTNITYRRFYSIPQPPSTCYFSKC